PFCLVPSGSKRWGGFCARLMRAQQGTHDIVPLQQPRRLTFLVRAWCGPEAVNRSDKWVGCVRRSGTPLNLQQSWGYHGQLCPWGRLSSGVSCACVVRLQTTAVCACLRHASMQQSLTISLLKR